MASNHLRVALTGATGFVGSSVLEHLIGAGHSVRALVRDASKLPSLGKELTPVKGDLFDKAALNELVKDVDAVVHLVGIIMEKSNAGQTFERVHVEGTKNLLTAATGAGVERWVHMSAIGARPDAVARYHQSKWQAEQAVRASGMKYTIFRPSIIHGPRGEFMQMIKDFWCKAFPPFVPYFGKGAIGKGGAGKLQPVWVEDVASCFTKALTNDRSVGETYPMGGPVEMTWPELYRTCKPYFPKAKNKPIVAVPVWYAKLIAGKPLVPFNADQVIMSQENSTCRIEKVQGDFEIELADFEEKVAVYGGKM